MQVVLMRMIDSTDSLVSNNRKTRPLTPTSKGDRIWYELAKPGIQAINQENRIPSISRTGTGALVSYGI
jgi:hypothetical protein